MQFNSVCGSITHLVLFKVCFDWLLPYVDFTFLSFDITLFWSEFPLKSVISLNDRMEIRFTLVRVLRAVWFPSTPRRCLHLMFCCWVFLLFLLIPQTKKTVWQVSFFVFLHGEFYLNLICLNPPITFCLVIEQSAKLRSKQWCLIIFVKY